MESFKKSKLSICADCCNIDQTCGIATSKTCGTDSKINAAFVQKCNFYKVPFENKPSRYESIPDDGYNEGFSESENQE